MNKKYLLFCLIGLFVSLCGFAETALQPKCLSSYNYLRDFFNRTLEEVKADILMNSGNIDQLFQEEFKGRSILLVAASRATPEMLEFILENGADTEYVSSHKTALCVAVESSRSNSVKILLEYGANPNFEWSGNKPIDIAVDRYVLSLLIGKVMAKYPKKVHKKEPKINLELKKEAAKNVKLLLAVTELKEGFWDNWKRAFYLELENGISKVKFTKKEAEQEWKIFLDLIKQ